MGKPREVPIMMSLGEQWIVAEALKFVASSDHCRERIWKRRFFKDHQIEEDLKHIRTVLDKLETARVNRYRKPKDA